jgi:hydrogenase maturation protease
MGQRAAGDDAVGLMVLDALRRQVPTGEVDLREAADATDLIPLLHYRGPVVLIDAFVGAEAPGTIRQVPVDAIEADGAKPVSSHALEVRQAIELARMLDPAGFASPLRIVGIGIAPPRGIGTALSIRVARAVPRAADLALRLAGEHAS